MSSEFVPFDFKIICNFITNSDTMAGGYRILIELSKRWLEKGHAVSFYTSRAGAKMIKRYIPNGATFIVTGVPLKVCGLMAEPMPLQLTFGFIQTFLGSTVSMNTYRTRRRTIVFSATPFLPDIIPSYLLKKIIPDAKWIAPLSMFSPDPMSGGFSGPFKKHSKVPRLGDLAFYYNEKLLYQFMKDKCSAVNVTNELDRQRCLSDGFKENQVIVIKGGVDCRLSQSIPDSVIKIYDAVFIGRLHPQKGPLELIDIWKKVCDRKPKAKLAIIGNGPLERQVKAKIDSYNLCSNIEMLGFLDGLEKTKIFKNSKIVLHPAIYDSGGMAACEAMVCGLPGVSFDLPALRVYYPKGMLKTECYNLDLFSSNIIRLLNDTDIYKKLQSEALECSKDWDWDNKAIEVLSFAKALFVEKATCHS